MGKDPSQRNYFGFEAASPPRSLRPEEALLLAVFEQALHDAEDPDPVVREGALDYLYRDDPGGPFSAVNACSHFGLDLKSVRSVIGRYRAAKRRVAQLDAGQSPKD